MVFVNVPKMVADKMPWSEPPSRATLNDKQGQPAAAVEKLYKSYSPSNQAPVAR